MRIGHYAARWAVVLGKNQCNPLARKGNWGWFTAMVTCTMICDMRANLCHFSGPMANMPAMSYRIFSGEGYWELVFDAACWVKEHNLMISTVPRAMSNQESSFITATLS